MSTARLTAGRRRARRLAPTLALTAAGGLIAMSLFFPYWEMNLVTPAQPGSLHLVSYLDHVDGPLDAVLLLAGRSGEARLRELSELERSLPAATATVICLLVVAATFVHNRWAALLSLPALVFPAIVIADTSRWLRPVVSGLFAGTGEAAEPSRIPFGRIAAGATVLETRPGTGLLVAVAASVMVLCGLWLHRWAYKPLVEGGV